MTAARALRNVNTRAMKRLTGKAAQETCYTNCCAPECCMTPLVRLASTGANAPAPTITGTIAGSASASLSASNSQGLSGSVATASSTAIVGATPNVLPGQIQQSVCTSSSWRRETQGPTQSPQAGVEGTWHTRNYEDARVTFAATAGRLTIQYTLDTAHVKQDEQQFGQQTVLIHQNASALLQAQVTIDLLTGAIVSSFAGLMIAGGAATVAGTGGGAQLPIISQSITLDASGNGTISVSFDGTALAEFMDVSRSATVSGAGTLDINLTIADLVDCNPPAPPTPLCCNFSEATCGPVNLDTPENGNLVGRVSFSMVNRLQRGRQSLFSSCEFTDQLRMVNDGGVIGFDVPAIVTSPACQVWEPANILDQNNIVEYAIDGYSGCDGVDSQTDASRHLVSFDRNAPGPSNAPLGVRNGFGGFTGVGMQYESSVFGDNLLGTLLLRATYYDGVPRLFARHTGGGNVGISSFGGDTTDPAFPWLTIPIDAGTNQGQGTIEVNDSSGSQSHRIYEYDVQFFVETSADVDGTPPPCGDNIRSLSVIGFLRVTIGDQHPSANARGQLTHLITFSLTYEVDTPFLPCPPPEMAAMAPSDDAAKRAVPCCGQEGRRIRG